MLFDKFVEDLVASEVASPPLPLRDLDIKGLFNLHSYLSDVIRRFNFVDEDIKPLEPLAERLLDVKKEILTRVFGEKTVDDYNEYYEKRWADDFRDPVFCRLTYGIPNQPEVQQDAQETIIHAIKEGRAAEVFVFLLTCSSPSDRLQEVARKALAEALVQEPCDSKVFQSLLVITSMARRASPQFSYGLFPFSEVFPLENLADCPDQGETEHMRKLDAILGATDQDFEVSRIFTEIGNLVEYPNTSVNDDNPPSIVTRSSIIALSAIESGGILSTKRDAMLFILGNPGVTVLIWGIGHTRSKLKQFMAPP